LPGFSKPYTVIGIDADVLQKIETAYFLKTERPDIWRTRKGVCQKLWLIPWLVEYEAIYVPDAVRELRLQLGDKGRHLMAPGKLEKLNIQTLMNLHLSMCPELPEYYGNLREINLRRDGVFMDHKSIESALNLLVNAANENILEKEQDPIAFAAFLLSDFLSIHPFINGNRRTAMRVVDFYLSKFKISVEWDNISISEIYYWCRLSSRGHCAALISGIRKNSFINFE
jgi:prophage maintenance system killer protein